MARLYSDLIDGSGRRYYFGLNSAPGGITPATSGLVIAGLTPVIFQVTQVFRTPSPANLIIAGLQARPEAALVPNVAALTFPGLVPSKVTIRTITNSLPTPDYTVDAGLAPTILFIATVQPAAAQLTLNSPPINLTQGGNIGYVNPLPGSVTINGLISNFVFNPIGSGLLLIQGRAPTIYPSRTVTPDVGALYTSNLIPFVSREFIWIDIDPPPPLTWTRVA